MLLDYELIRRHNKTTDMGRRRRLLAAQAAGRMGAFAAAPVIDNSHQLAHAAVVATTVERCPYLLRRVIGLELADVIACDKPRASASRARCRAALAPVLLLAATGGNYRGRVD
jgi:hypothetical protein